MRTAKYNKDDVIAAFDEGLNIAELTQRFNIERSMVYKLLREENLSIAVNQMRGLFQLRLFGLLVKADITSSELLKLAKVFELIYKDLDVESKAILSAESKLEILTLLKNIN